MTDMYCLIISRHALGSLFGLTARLIGSGILCYILSSAKTSADSKYFIEGTLNLVNNWPTPRTNSMTFQVKVSECHWSIELFPNSSEATNNIHSFRQEFDGTNLFSLTYYEKRLGNTQNDTSGTVEFNQVPNGRMGSHIGKLWLAYASQCYFAGLTNSRMEPIWLLEPKDRDQHLTIPATWKLNDDVLKLPVSVDLFDDGFIRSAKLPKPIKRPPPFENGFLAAQYLALAWTNLGEMRFPLKFVSRHFMAKPDAKSQNDTRNSSTAVGQLTNFRPLNKGDKWINLETNSVYLEDRRISSVSTGAAVLEYAVKNKQIPDTTKVASMNYALGHQQLPAASTLPEKKEFSHALAAEISRARVKKPDREYFYLILQLCSA